MDGPILPIHQSDNTPNPAEPLTNSTPPPDLSPVSPAAIPPIVENSDQPPVAPLPEPAPSPIEPSATATNAEPVDVDTSSQTTPTIQPPITSPPAAASLVEPLSNAPAESAPTGFNWGAFWLSWLWGIGHGLWLSLLILPIWIVLGIASSVVSFVSIFFGSKIVIIAIFIISIIANISLNIWFGRKGNEWSWSRRGNRDLVAQIARERRWMIWGWIVGALVILGWISTAMSLINPSAVTTTDCAQGVSITINGVDQCQESQ